MPITRSTSGKKPVRHSAAEREAAAEIIDVEEPLRTAVAGTTPTRAAPASTPALYSTPADVTLRVTSMRHGGTRGAAARAPTRAAAVSAAAAAATEDPPTSQTYAAQPPATSLGISATYDATPPAALAAHLTATGATPPAVQRVAPPPALAAHLAANVTPPPYTDTPEYAPYIEAHFAASRPTHFDSTPATAVAAVEPATVAGKPAATAAPAQEDIVAASQKQRSVSRRSRKSERALRYERANLQFEIAQARLAAAKARLAALDAEYEESDNDDTCTGISEAETSQRVDNWLQHSEAHLRDAAHNEPLPPTNTSPETRAAPPTVAVFTGPQATGTPLPTRQETSTQLRPSYEQPRDEVSAPSNNVVAIPQSPKTDIVELAEALNRGLMKAQARPYLSRHFSELPAFYGSQHEWLAFRAAYNETADAFTNVENTARLRRSLRGKAKEAVDNLLVHYTDPHVIMKALESRFGRPENIANEELGRLRSLPRLEDTPQDICIFASKVANVVAALRALNKTHYLHNSEITKLTVGKLPPDMRRDWFRYYKTQPKEEPDLLKLSNFLNEEAADCGPFAEPEKISTPPEERQDRTQQRQRRSQPPQRTHATQDRPTEFKCAVCDTTGHGIAQCKRFNDADINERWDMAKKARLCFRCLRVRTKNHTCKPKRCERDGCIYLHHSLLHNAKPAVPNIEKKEAVISTWTKKATTQAYLKIAPVTVSGPAGEVDTWALLDDGSTVTLIDASLAEEVGARGPVEPLAIEAIADTKLNSARSRRVTLTLQGRTRGRHRVSMRTIDELKISPQKVNKRDLESCGHLQDIRGRLPTDCATPRLLIGQDNWHLLLAKETRRGRRNQPVASLTPLGWVLHGAHSRSLGQRVNFITQHEENMDEQLRQYFAIENLIVNPKTPSSDPDRRAIEILDRDTTQLESGHYQTALLWKEDDVQMPNNFDAAERRLISVEKKIARDPQLAAKYKQQMNALVEKGYAELAPPEKTPGKTWYLPHFAVVNAMKPEKLRIVHDAAAKTMGKSLNDHLLTGPDLLQSLPGVLMRFRQHQIAVSADIAEMFMQVKIRPEDRDALRYLWREHTEDKPTEYRMTSLIFGATCSPSIAIYVKNANAKKHMHEQPHAAEAIIRNHYMDDYLASYRTNEEAIEVAKRVKQIHEKGRFELRKWTSNSTEVVAEITDESKPVSSVTITDSGNIERVLGLVWKPATDELAFNLNLARVPREVLESDAPTKREALRIVMSLYDPLGLASPVTSRAKQLLQELWRRGTDWDQRIDNDLAEQWQEWMNHLRALRDVAVPRCYLRSSEAASLQLHTFTDASETAYAAALYWRATTADGRIATSLVVAKSRVAPLKLTSIPRLELQAAVMGSRMAAAVIEEHDRKPDAKFFWTDSRTVLTWLKTGSRSYRPFVAHRIAAIEEHSTVQEWSWVPTKDNVADDATRDVPSDFSSDHRWYTGPRFLLQPEDTWPREKSTTVSSPTGEEKCTMVRTTSNKLKEVLPDAERFSKWEKYLRATARILQFIDLCRRDRQRTHYKRTRKNNENDPAWTRLKKTDKPIVRKIATQPASRRYIQIDADTQRRAEALIIRHSQQEAFGEEIRSLELDKPISRSSRLHPLSITYTNGLIRLDSRIRNAPDISETMKTPPVLDGNRHEVKLIIEFTHRQLMHAGVEATINECRQHYWILRLRPTAKMVLHRCIPCRIRRDAPRQPQTGSHPPCRLAHHQRPFTYTGVDYFGPLLTVVGRSTQKRYVAIFTCLTTRAVHLELAASLSTDSAVMALRRMIARRGAPAEIWSDNGTNLHGADRELRRALDEATEEEASKRTIRWRYIPPGAPFMGGAWERLVRATKNALAATQQSRLPTDEVLATVLTEAEYTVNSRPLTHVSVSPDDPEAITPNHFLLGGSARVPTPGTFTDNDLVGRTHWRASQRLADIFWSRWLREYLPELQHRREPHGRGPPIKIGDVVLIADGTLPRNTWPRGVVIATYPGADNVIRVVDVRTKGGVLRRPTKKLIIIPTEPAALLPGCNVAAGVARREDVRDDRQDEQ